MSDKTYTVKSLMAIVNLDNGSAVHLQRGAALPPNVDKGHLEHLLDNGFVEEGEVVGGLPPVESGDLQDRLTFRSEDEAKAAAKEAKDAEKDADKPAPRSTASRSAKSES